MNDIIYGKDAIHRTVKAVRPAPSTFRYQGSCRKPSSARVSPLIRMPCTPSSAAAGQHNAIRQNLRNRALLPSASTKRTANKARGDQIPALTALAFLSYLGMVLPSVTALAFLFCPV